MTGSQVGRRGAEQLFTGLPLFVAGPHPLQSCQPLAAKR